MSYCRFSNGDVYMYDHYQGFICCCACRLTEKIDHEISDETIEKFADENNGIRLPKIHSLYQDRGFFDARFALKHLYKHKKADHKVGRGAITKLKRKIKNEY